jgi:hypothetical protein
MSKSSIPIQLQEIEFYSAAQDYLRMLRTEHPEHFMEAKAQGRQREITMESFSLVHADWPAFQYFNEMLVQYRRRGEDKIRQIVPDNMVVLYETELAIETSYDVPLQPVGPFWVLEYVSRKNKRKDYVNSFDKYEKDLKAPYYLMFYPDDQELSLFRHNKRKYVSVKPNAQGRYAIPELEMELALLDRWVRYWFRGKLLPLPAQMQKDLNQLRQQNDQLQREVQEQTKRAKSAEDELDRLRAEVERLRRKRNGA